MKVLWILNSPIGEIARVLGLNRSQSGTWIDAAMESLLEQTDAPKLTVMTTAPITETLCKTENGVTYTCIPAGKMLRGKRASKKQLKCWKQAIDNVSPDLIHIWGTEFSLGYDLRNLFHKIPFIYTMQGVMTYISRYPYLTLPKMRQNVNLFSKIRCLKYRKEQTLQKLQARLEQQMIAQADGIISDNEWAVAPFLSNENAEKFHFIRLPIKKQFRQNHWCYEEAVPNTVFCIAGRNGLKGIHQVIEAAARLVSDFPDLQVLIPGNIEGRKPTFFFEPPYVEYLKKLISKYHLENNIRFLGRLNTEEMIAYMKQAKVFLMPSAIENESSTLREAMFLGMPVVSSFAGDIYETVVHGENGFMYRFAEPEMLAYFTRMLLNSPERSIQLGAKAGESIRNLYADYNYGKSLLEVYYARKR